mgnify:CR=1 FL=1
MDENSDNMALVYIQKQEQIVLEYVRKQVDYEIKMHIMNDNMLKANEKIKELKNFMAEEKTMRLSLVAKQINVESLPIINNESAIDIAKSIPELNINEKNDKNENVLLYILISLLQENFLLTYH